MKKRFTVIFAGFFVRFSVLLTAARAAMFALASAMLCAWPPGSFAQSAQSPQSAPQDAAWVAHRFALDLDGSGAYYALALPQTVYAASQRDDLGDLRVFNGAGEPVPYSLDAPRVADAQTAQIAPQRRALRWYPLPPATGGAQSAPPGVSVAADGSLRVTGAAQAPSARGGDLIDLGQTGRQNEPGEQVRALLVHLRNARYQGRVNVEAGSDLSTWEALTDTQLLKVDHAGSTLTQERIDLDGTNARYLRLSWPDGAPDIASVEVEVQKNVDNAAGRAAPQRQWRDGVGMRAGQAPGEYLFETDGAYPVDRLRLTLPQPNTVARATLYSRANAQTPWREVAASVLYRLRGKTGEQTSPPLELDADADRQWRIVVDMRNGGLGSGVPLAAVGWRAAILTFVARGAAPFVLGVGNAALESAAASRDELMPGATPDVVAAHVGAALPVSPRNASSAPGAAKDGDAPRRYVLWAALLLAVAVLGGMAWRLVKGQGSGTGKA